MPDLLFISDNPKVEQIRDLLQPMLKLEIGVTSDVERAMKDVLNHSPTVICIQERMAGATAEEIVRRIRTIPELGTPQFVLLREKSDTAVPPEELFKHAIDLTLPVEQLIKSILRAVLQPALKLRWSEIDTSCEQDRPAVSLREETEPEESPATPTKSTIPAELLKAFEQNYRSRRRYRWMQYAAVSLTACLVVFAWHLTSYRHDQGGTISQTLPARPATAPVPPAKKSTPTPASTSAAIAQKVPAAAPVPPAKKNTPTPASTSAVIAQKVPAAAPVPPVKKNTPTPASTSAAIVQKVSAAPRKPAAGTAKAFELPSFIPKKGRDSAYSRQKPGWERYTSSTREFRILRSANRIKAVQVLAATPDAISEAFLKSVLGEISGTNTYRETSQKEEHGFLVKRGNAGPGVKILIYTQKSRIRAFVISTS